MAVKEPRVTPKKVEATEAGPRRRVEAIDLMRGLVMVIMALDHTRDFFHNGRFDPTDLSQASAGLFLTRLITHLCAPTFVFLAGTAASLSGAARGPRWRQSLHLITRGLWLVLLELTVVAFGWRFGVDFHRMTGQVIWALGCSMVALAALIWLPLWAMAAVSGAMVLLHNLTDAWTPEAAPVPAWLWTVLHVQAPIQISEQISFFVFYPLIPWIGVMALGYVFGALLPKTEKARQRQWLALGLALTVAFVVMRAINRYGDPHPWQAPAGRPSWFAALAFVNTEKYPPSLLYLLMTLGAMFLIMAAMDLWRPGSRLAGGIRHAVMVFGRVPLFYYVIHLPLIHGLAALEAYARYGPRVAEMARNPWERNWGHDLPVVYGVWALVILILYPLCARYDAYKRAHPAGWTRYL